MKNRSFLKLAIVIFSIFFVSGCANSATHDVDNKSLSFEIHKYLAQGVAVIVYHMTNMDKASEQYADWSEYLNDFVASHSGNYKVFSADDEFFKIMKRNKLNGNKEYSIFMKKGYPTYYYDGVIVEKAVYLAVRNKYVGKTLSGMDKAFLPKEISFSLQEK